MEKKKPCAPRKVFELFEDRIFPTLATDASHPSTPSKRLQSSKSISCLSAAPKTLHYGKMSRQVVGHKNSPSAQGGEPSSSAFENQPQTSPNTSKLLRRHKTCQDLRSSQKPSCEPKSPEKPHATDKTKIECRSHFHQPLSKESSRPLVSRTNQKQKAAPVIKHNQLPVKGRPIGNAPDDLATNGGRQTTSVPPAPNPTKLELTYDMISGTETPTSKVNDHEGANEQNSGAVHIQHLDDGLRSPEDFFRPATHSVPETGGTIYDPVQQVDVATCWKNLTYKDAEEMFFIHTIFQAALKWKLATDVQSMIRKIKRDFVLGTGETIYRDGFKVAIENRLVYVDREELVYVMTEMAYDFFSNRHHQPDRSALMQLYLSSREFFLDWPQGLRQKAARWTTVGLRTCYDQLSQFEAPASMIALFRDYVDFPNLNHTPHEDEYIFLTPRYNHQGGYLQDLQAKDVEYTMENPIQWLTWNANIKGFAGRVPPYSAFPESFVASKGSSAITHVLDITINAVIRKYCTIGKVHFERKVRSRLQLPVLRRAVGSAMDSGYGSDHQNSVVPSHFEHLQRGASYSNDSDEAPDSHYGYVTRAPRTLTQPKRQMKTSHPLVSIGSPSADGSFDADWPRKFGHTSHRARRQMPSTIATVEDYQHSSPERDASQPRNDPVSKAEIGISHDDLPIQVIESLDFASKTPRAKQQIWTNDARAVGQTPPSIATCFPPSPISPSELVHVKNESSPQDHEGGMTESHICKPAGDRYGNSSTMLPDERPCILNTEPEVNLSTEPEMLESPYIEHESILCGGKDPVNGRLGLEEEMALRNTIENSREEQLQRRMTAQGLQASFDDIFYDNASEQGFDDASTANYDASFDASTAEYLDDQLMTERMGNKREVRFHLMDEEAHGGDF